MMICAECGTVNPPVAYDYCGPCYGRGHMFRLVEEVELRQRIERNEAYPPYAAKLKRYLEILLAAMKAA